MTLNILIFISCLCLIFVFGKILIFPIKWILKIILNSAIGGIIIYFINFIGHTWGFEIGINCFTTLIVRYFRSARSYISNNIKINNIIPLEIESKGTFLE